MSSTTEALALFSERVARFECDYSAVIEAVLRHGLPTTVCTIYDGNLSDPREARLARVALMLFNDVILRTAFSRSLGVVDLRLICCEPGDYANDIEPSGQGGAKIARAIARAAGALEAASKRSEVFSG